MNMNTFLAVVLAVIKTKMWQKFRLVRKCTSPLNPRYFARQWSDFVRIIKCSNHSVTFRKACTKRPLHLWLFSSLEKSYICWGCIAVAAPGVAVIRAELSASAPDRLVLVGGSVQGRHGGKTQTVWLANTKSDTTPHCKSGVESD